MKQHISCLGCTLMKVLSICNIHKECAFLNHAPTAVERITAHNLHDLNKNKAVNTFREKDIY